MTTLLNPYWDAVRDRVSPTGSLWRTPSVDWTSREFSRHDFTKRYAWTISDPETVAFVVEHSRGRLVDPMAGTGYWAWLLAQAGVDVTAYDEHPPALGYEDNHWHRNVSAHCSVLRTDAADAVVLDSTRTLLLSWPPYGFDACPILNAYQGDRVIYMGEGEYGCCGTDELFAAFERDWTRVAERVPVQWDGLHDVVNVYDRRQP